MTNSLYIATSLDGFIADTDGGVAWLNDIPNPDGSDYGFAEFMSGVDAVVMGRKTFDTVLAFEEWPYDKPVFVLSHSLKAVPTDLSDRAELLAGEPREVVRELHQRGLKDLYVDGGRTIRGFLKADLIDEMTITTVPLLLGGGVPLFGDNERRLSFSLVSTDVLPGGLTKSKYKRNP
jgi:dihydrofolate reductase